MKYKCTGCGRIFSENELNVKEWEESRGEYWGMPCSETMSELVCPICNSGDDLEEFIEDEED